MRLSSCLIVALGAVGAVTASPLTARAQQEAAPAPRGSPAKSNPMKVTLVRSNAADCEPACAEWIAAQGQIDETTPEEFRRVLARLGPRKLPILIDSVGGEVDAALTIGRMIRAKGMDIVVTRTVLEPCIAAPIQCQALRARGFETGRPQARISRCASACAFVLAGGVRRYVGAWTLVGLHEIKAVSTLRLIRQHYRLEQSAGTSAPTPPQKRIIKEEVLKVETRESPAGEGTYATVGRYFADMGIAPAIMPIMRAAPNSAIHWLRIAELRSTGLATDFVNGEQLLASKPAAATDRVGSLAGSIGAPARRAPASGPAPQVPPSGAAPKNVAMQQPSRLTTSAGQGAAPKPAATPPIRYPGPRQPKAEPNDPFAQIGN